MAVGGMGVGGRGVASSAVGSGGVRVGAGVSVGGTSEEIACRVSMSCSSSLLGTFVGTDPVQADRIPGIMINRTANPSNFLIVWLISIQVSYMNLSENKLVERKGNVALQYNPLMLKITLFLRRWGPALLMMALIFGFSSVPSADMPDFGFLDLLVKKGGHALGYGLLALSFLHGLMGDSKDIYTRWLYLAWSLAVVYSMTDEFHQTFTLGRHPAVTDVLIDSFGAALALLLVYRYYKQKQTASATGR